MGSRRHLVKRGKNSSEKKWNGMDDLRFRKIFNLGITKDKNWKNCKVWLRNVVKYGKYSPAKLANLYTFVLCVEIGN